MSERARRPVFVDRGAGRVFSHWFIFLSLRTSCAVCASLACTTYLGDPVKYARALAFTFLYNKINETQLGSPPNASMLSMKPTPSRPRRSDGRPKHVFYSSTVYTVHSPV